MGRLASTKRAFVIGGSKRVIKLIIKKISPLLNNMINDHDDED